MKPNYKFYDKTVTNSSECTCRKFYIDSNYVCFFAFAVAEKFQFLPKQKK